MRYVVLDTDVASRAIKGTLSHPLAARLTGMAWCVTFVTVGELWQWATTRSWGPRTREDLELWLGRVVVLNSDDAISPAGIRRTALAPDAISRVPAGRPARARPLASCGPGRGSLDRPTLSAGPPADPRRVARLCRPCLRRKVQ
jgi:hypothetical protein